MGLTARKGLTAILNEAIHNKKKPLTETFSYDCDADPTEELDSVAEDSQRKDNRCVQSQFTYAISHCVTYE